MKTKGNQKSRRKFIHNIATLTAGVTVGSSKLWGAPAYLPNLLQTNASKGVQVGLITYSFRSLEDQSAEATLQYTLDSGANSVELMGRTAESFIGRPESKVNRRIFYRLIRKERKKTLTKDETKELAELKKQQKSFDKEIENWKKTRSIDAYNAETSSQLAFVFLAVHFPATCILALLRIVIDGPDVMSSP